MKSKWRALDVLQSRGIVQQKNPATPEIPWDFLDSTLFGP